MKIMFICTGNICRSAMAHRLLEKKLKEQNRKDIEVYSCGIYAETGDGPTEEAIQVMKDMEVDITKHRATNIKKSNIQEMDIILCATNSHKNMVISMYPELKEKTYTLKQYVKYNKENHDPIDISDPWGYGESIYRYCVNEIDECLDMLLKN